MADSFDLEIRYTYASIQLPQLGYILSRNLARTFWFFLSGNFAPDIWSPEPRTVSDEEVRRLAWERYETVFAAVSRFCQGGSCPFAQPHVRFADEPRPPKVWVPIGMSKVCGICHTSGNDPMHQETRRNAVWPPSAYAIFQFDSIAAVQAIMEGRVAHLNTAGNILSQTPYLEINTPCGVPIYQMLPEAFPD